MTAGPFRTNGFPFDQIRQCSSCTLSQSRKNVVPGKGPVPAKVVLLGEGPGEEEDNRGEPFIGRAGRLLDSLLGNIGWNRGLCFITNCIHCRPPHNAKPSPKQISACSHWLDIELGMAQPEILVLMGATAISRVLGPGAGTVEHLHGNPIVQDVLGKSTILLPMYHPAAALYETAQLRFVYDDFQILKGLIAGNDPQQYLADDEHPNPSYVEISNLRDYHSIVALMVQRGLVSADVETVNNKLWSVQICFDPGAAYFIGPDLLQQVVGSDGRFHFPPGVRVIFHNYLYDYQFVHVDDFVDTMVMAYQLGLPQGLKELAHRICGMEMQSYDDLVSGSGRKNAIGYLTQAAHHEWPKPEPMTEVKWDNKAGKVVEKVRNPQPIARKIKRILADFVDNPTVDPYKRWVSIEQTERDTVERELGSMPASTIANISRDEAVKYACLSRDSRVLMASGKYKRVGDLVNRESHECVMSWDKSSNQLVPKEICGWYKQHHPDRVPWLSVILEQSRVSGKVKQDGVPGTRYTADHRLLTERGWVAVSDLIPGSDCVAMPVMALTSIQRQILFGSTLGDGSLRNNNRLSGWANLIMIHGGKQEEYLRWKVDLLGSICKPVTRTEYVSVEHNNFRGGQDTVRLSAETHKHPEISLLHEAAYTPKKSINSWCNGIDGLAVAIWYMDDGSLINDTGAKLSTQGFDIESVDHIRNVLLHKFNITTSRLAARRDRPDQYIINILSPYDRFWSVVARYVPNSMQYKLPTRWRGVYNDIVCDDSPKLFYSRVVSVVSNPVNTKRWGSRRTSYCIDVKSTHNFVTPNEVAHNCRDADATLRVYNSLEPKIREYGLGFILNVDLSILGMVQEMQDTGIALDVVHLQSLSSEYSSRMASVAEDLAKKAGHAFNPGSSAQVAQVVYKELGFTPTKLTDGGAISTDDRELKKIDHPIVKEILEYRRMAKNKDAFADALVERAVRHNDHYRIHTTLKATRTETGRLSSSGPNLQAVPAHTMEAKKIRKAFVATR